ncbi:MAG: AMP-binding protein, partial [Actinomadura sp.]
TADGVPYPPRRLHARVPQELDGIVCRAIGIDPAEEPLTTPAELAQALGRVPRTPLPLFAGPSAPRRDDTAPRPRQDAPPAATGPTSTVPAAVPTTGFDFDGPGRGGHGRAGSHRLSGPARHDRPPVNRRLIAVAATLATIVVGVGGWQLSQFGGGPPVARNTPPATSAPADPVKLTISSATGFDPTRPDRPDPTARGTGNLAIDGSTRTAWHTQTYHTANFGMLKDGLGVLLDMGHPVDIETVRVTLPSGSGKLELRVGNTKEMSALDVVATASDTAEKVDLKPAEAAKGQYVLLWFTELPVGFKAEVSDVDVLGPAG